jgi:hypothetical protein
VLIRLPPPDPTATALIRPQLPRSGCCHLYRPATRGAPGATLSREVGATPPPPLPPPSVGGQGVAPSRSGRRCLYLVATLLGLPPPPSTITTTSTSATSASKGYHLHVVLIGFYSSHSIRAITTLQLRGDVSLSDSTFDLFLQSHRLWCSRCDCGGC